MFILFEQNRLTLSAFKNNLTAEKKQAGYIIF